MSDETEVKVAPVTEEKFFETNELKVTYYFREGYIDNINVEVKDKDVIPPADLANKRMIGMWLNRMNSMFTELLSNPPVAKPPAPPVDPSAISIPAPARKSILPHGDDAGVVMANVDPEKLPFCQRCARKKKEVRMQIGRACCGNSGYYVVCPACAFRAKVSLERFKND